MSINKEEMLKMLNRMKNRGKVGAGIIWKPVEGDNTIRIVPLKSNPSLPFITRQIHYIDNSSILSPVNFNQPDPLLEFAKMTRSESEGGMLPTDVWNVVKKLYPATRTFVPIVVRGKEAEGVKFWGFGKTTFEKLVAFFNDDELGDLSDVKTGHDIVLHYTSKENSDTNYAKTEIQKVFYRSSPLTTDDELLNTLLNSQPNLDDAFDTKTYDELKNILDKFLGSQHTTPWDKQSEDPKVSEAIDAVEPSAPISETAKGVVDKFDAVFNKK
jgi:hypothetical protein